MADVHDKETRRYNMSRIKNKSTKPEILVRKRIQKNKYPNRNILATTYLQTFY